MILNTILLGQKPSGNSFATFLWYRLPIYLDDRPCFRKTCSTKQIGTNYQIYAEWIGQTFE